MCHEWLPYVGTLNLQEVVWVCCPGNAGVHSNERANSLASRPHNTGTLPASIHPVLGHCQHQGHPILGHCCRQGKHNTGALPASIYPGPPNTGTLPASIHLIPGHCRHQGHAIPEHWKWVEWDILQAIRNSLLISEIAVKKTQSRLLEWGTELGMSNKHYRQGEEAWSTTEHKIV